MPPRRYNKAGPGYKYFNKENLNTASKALAVALQVKRLVNPEYKTLNTNLAGDPNTTGIVVSLCGIAQGDDISNRTGSKIRAKYLRARGKVVINASATASSLRIMIVRDNLGTTTAPGIDDLFASVTDFHNNKNKDGDPQSNARFSILWDKFILLDAVFKSQVAFDYNMSLDHHISFTGTSATDEGKGCIYALMASSEATNDPVVTADVMIKWLDN